jgi:hypothetical protein
MKPRPMTPAKILFTKFLLVSTGLPHFRKRGKEGTSLSKRIPRLNPGNKKNASREL